MFINYFPPFAVEIHFPGELVHERAKKKREEELLCVLWFGLNPVVLPTELGSARQAAWAATWWGFSPHALSLSLSVNIRRQDRMCCWGGQTELIFNFILHVYHHGRMSPFFVGLTDQPETSTMCFEHGCPRINLGNESNFWLFIGTIRRNVQQIRCLVVWSFTRNFEMVFNAESTKWVILVLVHEFLKLLQLTWNTYILITENATVLKAIQAILILLQFEFSRKANPLPNQQTNPYSW